MKDYKIYVYEFSNNYCYIGLTKNIKNRDDAHRTDKSSGVYKHSQSFNEEIPLVKILEEDLDEYEAQSSEDNWCKYYYDKGWLLLNKAKIGLFSSSLGGINSSIVDIKKAKESSDLSLSYNECLNIAKKYEYLSDFRIEANSYYEISRKYGWKFDWLKRSKPINNGKVNIRDMSYDEMKAIACKYNTRTEFSLHEKTLYMKCLSNGYIDDFFPRKKKVKTNSDDNELISDDDLRNIMQSYTTKSDFHKNDKKYYELCRKRDLLKEFVKKDSKSSKTNYHKGIINYDDSIIKYEISDFFLKNKNIVVCEKYGSKYVFNKDDMCLYYIYKTLVSRVRIHFDKYGIPCYKIGSSYTYVFEIINDFLYNSECNLFKFKDGNYKNINMDNIEHCIIDLNDFSKMAELDTFLINSHGEIYSVKHMMLMPLDEINGYLFFKGFRIDKLVVKYFHEGYNTLKNIEVLHKDGNLLNNEINNLDIELKNKKTHKKNFLLVENVGETNRLYIDDHINDKKYFLGLIKNKKVIDAIKVDILNYIAKNHKIEEWISEYQSLYFKEWQKKDNDINMIELRVNSNGCYYSEIHKLWKSKIFYNNKEYSLGYFHTFEAGKMLYDEAVMYIKHGKFEKWYENIESHRERMKYYFE